MRKRDSLSRMGELATLKRLGRRFYMAIKRAQRAGYQFKFCISKNGVLTVRPWDGIIGGTESPHAGCMARTVFIRWGRRRGYKTMQVVRFGRPPFNRTLKVPKEWKTYWAKHD